MALLCAALVAAASAAITVPAGATDPIRQQLVALKRQVTKLQTQVQGLSRKVSRLEVENRTLGERAKTRESDVLGLRIVLSRATSCPVTHPNGSTPPDGRPNALSHGNGRLWVSLWTRGVVVPGDGVRRDDALVSVKYGWWREVRGVLTITGRRLDADRQTFRGDVANGYGDTGPQPSSISFPSPGCWEITGTAGGASLTFVVLVVGRV